MIKTRDPVAISSVGEYLESCADELKEAELLLNKHINEISNYYKGKDSNIIISKFLEASSRMEIMIANFKYYSQYFKTLSDHDVENLALATQKFQELLDETNELNDSSLINNVVDDIEINKEEVKHV